MRCVALLPAPDARSSRLYDELAGVCSDLGLDFEAVNVEAVEPGSTEELTARLSGADLVIIDSTRDLQVMTWALGVLANLDFAVVNLVDTQSTNRPRDRWRHLRYLTDGRQDKNFHNRIRSTLERFARTGSLAAPVGRSPSSVPVDVDFDRLSSADFENLCFELLQQLGYRGVRWEYRSALEIDLLAMLPKRDPDGHSYEEPWLIAFATRAPASEVVRRAVRELETSPPEMFEKIGDASPGLTLLVLTQESGRRLGNIEAEYVDRHYGRSRRPGTAFRVRVWGQSHLRQLLRKYPEIALKYSDSGLRGAPSSARKSDEQLRIENLRLFDHLQTATTELEAERTRRVAAERDAIWKEVAFQAAHKLGNPLYAIETDLQVLADAVRTSDAAVQAEVLDAMQVSLEKAKSIISQFKTITRADDVQVEPVDVRGLVEHASRVGRQSGMEIEVSSEDAPVVMADAAKLTECLDELIRNAIDCTASVENPCLTVTLAERVVDDGTEVDIVIADNGPGIPADDKESVFRPFFSTRDGGSGLGLSIVQSSVIAQGGRITEDGQEGAGARFTITLKGAPSENQVA